ncbi:MAG: hypothetical protein LBR29_03695 [Methylobacteriaceae bacterium]|jgi:hypothetical protein|nr:hypothetical protein [Methylobacteriaceae bacterium]
MLLRTASVVVAGLFMTASAWALDYSVEPKVKDLGITPKSVLYVGNSFLYYNCGVNGYVSGLTGAAKIPLRGSMVTISGSGLDWHLVKTYLRPDGLASYGFNPDNTISFRDQTENLFDVAILEDNSQGPIHPELSKFFQKSAAIHAKDAREANTIPVFMITWAYGDKPEMTKQLADATITVANENDAMVLPVGLAFAKAKEGKPDIRLLVADNRHPSAEGSYLMASVIFSTLFKKSPENLDFLGGCDKPLPKEEAAYLQKVAWETVKEFFGW